MSRKGTIKPPSNVVDKEAFRQAHLDFLAYALSPRGREEMKLTQEEIKRLTEEAERCSINP